MVVLFRDRSDGDVGIVVAAADSDVNDGQDQTPSTGHKWYIFVDTIENGENLPLMARYDPDGTSVTLDYNCDPDDHSTCYAGDLTNKFGRLNFPDMKSYRDTSLKFDDLPGRSIIVYQENNSILPLDYENIVTGKTFNAFFEISIDPLKKKQDHRPLHVFFKKLKYRGLSFLIGGKIIKIESLSRR